MHLLVKALLRAPLPPPPAPPRANEEGVWAQPNEEPIPRVRVPKRRPAHSPPPSSVPKAGGDGLAPCELKAPPARPPSALVLVPRAEVLAQRVTVMPKFAHLSDHMGRQLTVLMQKVDLREDELGPITVFNNGDVRIDLPTMRVAPWVVEGVWPIRGFHGTDPCGALGIMQSGAIRGGVPWPIIFFTGAYNCRSSSDMRAAFLQSMKQPRNRNSGLVFEIVVRTSYENLEAGGHDSETEVCQRVGCCHYGAGSLRWTSDPEATTVQALWVSHTADFLTELLEHEDFQI